MAPCKTKRRKSEGFAAAQARHAATAVAEAGVARLAGCLRPQTAAALRAHVIEEFERIVTEGEGDGGEGEGGDGEEEAEQGGFRLVAVGSGTQRFSELAGRGAAATAAATAATAAAATAAATASDESRWDLRLDASAPPVRAALLELLAAGHGAPAAAAKAAAATETARSAEQAAPAEPPALGAAVAALVGGDAQLWELAAIFSAPGAAPQVVHADAVWTPRPLLLTAFVALQPVTRAMGPTRFLPRTHVDPAPAAALRDGGDVSDVPLPPGARAPPSRVALLDAGDAALYDGRLLHCGGANRSDELRVLFYLTFRAADGGGQVGREEGGRRATAADGLTLDSLMAGRV